MGRTPSSLAAARAALTSSPRRRRSAEHRQGDAQDLGNFFLQIEHQLCGVQFLLQLRLLALELGVFCLQRIFGDWV